jgi:hypothetical protein
MTTGTEFQRLDAHIRDLAQRAERGAPMSESEVGEAIARFEQLIAQIPADISAESAAAIMASRMETHRAVVALLHRRAHGESQPEPHRATHR